MNFIKNASIIVPEIAEFGRTVAGSREVISVILSFSKLTVKDAKQMLHPWVK